jgi:antitoxin component YwqK of YwqJK toxin-antitoxin module
MVGDFFDGFFTGTGTFTFSNGSKHVGEWKAGERHGLGIEYEANGAVKRSGSWANNILINAFENNPSRFPFNSALEASLLIYAMLIKQFQ